MRKRHRNLRKAAILVASLDADNAAALLRQMSAGQAQLLQKAIERLGPIDPDEQAEVIEEFFRIGPLIPVKEPSGIELDGRLPKYLSMPTHPEPAPRAEPQPDETRPAHGLPPFRFLHEAPARSLAPFLEREHPQTIAVVVSHLPADRAAEILAGLPADLQVEVARRLVDLEETDPEILREVERGLESWLCEQVRSDRRRTAGLTALANILGAAEPNAKQNLLANLARRDRHLAGKLRGVSRASLTFAELEHLDRASLTVVLHHAQPELLVLALAGAGTEFADRVFALFPRAEATALDSALRNLGPTRLSDVEEAQQELVELARQLELRGEITPDIRGHLSVAV
jgi:flagellar motor switch protein FliG